MGEKWGEIEKEYYVDAHLLNLPKIGEIGREMDAYVSNCNFCECDWNADSPIGSDCSFLRCDVVV